MSDNPYQETTKGLPYPVRPEWIVRCADEQCKGFTSLTMPGEAATIAEAELIFARYPKEGWKKIDGLWYCGSHKGRRRK